jgi:hypothetical protein
MEEVNISTKEEILLNLSQTLHAILLRVWNAEETEITFFGKNPENLMGTLKERDPPIDRGRIYDNPFVFLR